MTQIIDGIYCNDAGWPIKSAKYEAEYWMLANTLNPNQSTGGIYSSVYNTGYDALLPSFMGNILDTAVRKPDGIFWHIVGLNYFRPESNGFIYAFDSWIHALEGHLNPSALEPSWRTDTGDRSHVTNSLPVIPATYPEYRHIAYLGRINHADLNALSDSDAVAYKARLTRAYEIIRDAGFDGIYIDASSGIGGTTGSIDPGLSNDAEPGSQWFRDHCRLYQQNHVDVCFGSEATVTASNSSGSRPPNRIQGRKSHEFYGVPTSCVFRGSQWTSAANFNGTNSNARFYAPIAEHRWFCLGVNIFGQPYDFAPTDTGAFNARRVHSTGGIVGINHDQWLSVDQTLPPSRISQYPALPRNWHKSREYKRSGQRTDSIQRSRTRQR